MTTWTIFTDDDSIYRTIHVGQISEFALSFLPISLAQSEVELSLSEAQPEGSYWVNAETVFLQDLNWQIDFGLRCRANAPVIPVWAAEGQFVTGRIQLWSDILSAPSLPVYRWHIHRISVYAPQTQADLYEVESAEYLSGQLYRLECEHLGIVQ
jgi:hypothetical protein